MIHRHFRVVALTASALILSGCADVQINSPLLDTLGLNPTKQAKVERKLTRGAKLVLPPKMKSLPPPGGAPAPAAVASNAAWPVDPDQVKKNKLYAECLKEQKLRKEGNWDPNKGGIEDFEANQDPLARSPGIFGTWGRGGRQKGACDKYRDLARNGE